MAGTKPDSESEVTKTGHFQQAPFPIALLAAVTEETILLRGQLVDSTEQHCNGLDLIIGRLAGHQVVLGHSGIGKAAAAAAATALLARYPVAALWMLGCGGAYPEAGLKIGDLALAEKEIFADEGVMTDQGFRDLAAAGIPMRHGPPPSFNIWPTDSELTRWARLALADHASAEKIALGYGPFATVSTCTGTTATALGITARTGAICENMEGAAAALACHQMTVPFLELRGISNLVENRQPQRWDLPAGMLAAQKAVLKLLATLESNPPL